MDSAFCKVHQSACSALKAQAIVSSSGGKTILADKAYSCDKIRNYLEEQGAYVCIPDKANFEVKHHFESEHYKQRIKNYRHVAFRFDKLAVCFFQFCFAYLDSYSLLIYQQPLTTVYLHTVTP